MSRGNQLGQTDGLLDGQTNNRTLLFLMVLSTGTRGEHTSALRTRMASAFGW